MRVNRRTAVLIVLAATVLLSLLLLPACCCTRRTAPPDNGRPRPEPEPTIGYAHVNVPDEAVPASPTQTQMQNVDFHEDSTIILRIRHLRGEMADKKKGQPLNFDDKRSFVMKIHTAEVGLDGRSLSDLMNHYIFNYPGASLRNLVISISGHQLRQEGILHKVIDIPFVMLADVSVTPEGMIRLHPTKIEICSLNGKGLMEALGVTLEKMIDVSRAPGVHVQKNDLLLEATKILPPPAIDAKLTSVRIEGNELVQEFNDGVYAPPLSLPRPQEKNWMYFRGGTLRMGKLFMVDADMQVIDTDPSDPFDFFIDYYNNQLVEGYEYNRPNYGLNTFMRDFSDLGHPLRPGERTAPR
jgi:hypothetical protein